MLNRSSTFKFRFSLCYGQQSVWSMRADVCQVDLFTLRADVWPCKVIYLHNSLTVASERVQIDSSCILLIKASQVFSSACKPTAT